MRVTVQKTSTKALPKIDFRVVHDIVNVHQRTEWRWLTLGMILLDLLMIAAGFILAYVIRFRLNIPFFFVGSEESPSLRFYITLGAFLIPFWIAIYAAAGLYSRQNILGGPVSIH
ncbi:hypothetical protein LARV_01189 [Longilinea arvoryzae]|uniref:RDD family n=1 Tax=Longilinea arvoryzae TaxID=360412 RepID=A0A0S7BHV7_9CHLR|nr:hypothetical protein [Longilinea arvoryzae]GAP13435.1 hypothetical protein LARV_01189 [Longilinea arvoryzae]